MTSLSRRSAVHAFVERHEVVWELTFAALAVVFVVLGFTEPADPDALARVIALEWIITGVFTIEFVLRLWAAPDRRRHFRGHLVDLVSLVPPARLLRPLRLLRLLRLIRTFAGVSRAMARVPRLARHQGLVWLVGAWLAVTVLTSVAMYIAENGVNAAFDDPFDAVWWGVVTLSTVGYGDVYPTTPEGRVAAIALMVLGIGLYSAITAAVTSYYVSQLGRGDHSIVDELERLASLHSHGALDDREYRSAKANVLRP